ncbi:MAG: transposase [Candidatus Heimdallarchaeota archaeon]|nr:transposase [Candidatus Heimdallarchaeota archaeon]
MSKTIACLKSKSTSSNLNNSIVSDDICTNSELNLSSSPHKRGTYTRQVVDLDGVHFVDVPRDDPLERLEMYGIMPYSKYSFDVYLHIAFLLSQNYSIDQMVKILHRDFPSLNKAHLSRKFIERVLKLTSAVVTPLLSSFAKLDIPFNLMIDGTVSTGGKSSLIIVLAHFPSDNSTFPLLATFLPSENKQDLSDILMELRDQLPSQPQAVISDFALGFQSTLPEVFPESVQLGCHFHLIELIARILVYPKIKLLNSKIKLFLDNLNTMIRKILRRERRNEEIRIFAQMLKQIISKNRGEFGARLLFMLEQLKAVQDALFTNSKYLRSEYKKLRSLFDRQKWEDIAELSEELRKNLERFNDLRDCLRPDNFYNSMETAEQALKIIIEDWKRSKIKELVKSAEKLENYIFYLIPAMYNSQYPRTTSILEGLNNQVKRTMRHWCGTQEVPSSFEWAGGLISIIHGIKESSLWSNLLLEIPKFEWMVELRVLRKKEKRLKNEKRAARWLAGLQPSSLQLQLELRFKENFLKEVIN